MAKKSASLCQTCHSCFHNQPSSQNYCQMLSWRKLRNLTAFSIKGRQSVNEIRKHLFSHNSKIENIPSTAKALEQHAKRATYVAGFIWWQALKVHPIAPSPEQWEQWGWVKDPITSYLTPHCTTLPEASKGCKELMKCGCLRDLSNNGVGVSKPAFPAVFFVLVLGSATIPQDLETKVISRIILTRMPNYLH